MDYTPSELGEKASKASCAFWANHNRLKLQGGRFSLKGREYLLEPMEDRSPRSCYMKATGGGFSECVGILPTIHGMRFGRYPHGVLYMFPTDRDVQDFSSHRFGSLIDNNHHAIGRFVKPGGKGSDRTALKKIGDSDLFLRGGRLSPSDEGVGAKKGRQLSGIQVDRIVPDEIDQMDPEAIAKARGRMKAASVDGVPGRSEQRYIANPSDEDLGIDVYWQESDQRNWRVQCTCSAWTFALREFIADPEKCVGLYGGKYPKPPNTDYKGFIRCSKCGKPIGNSPGEWDAAYPSRTEDMKGHQWSHLNSIFSDPAQILRDFRNPPEDNLGDVYRLELGIPYSSKDAKLEKAAVLRCCGNDAMLDRHPGPCAMGVDVKPTVKHVVIGVRTGNDQYEIFKTVEVAKMSDVHDVARRFNIKSAVVDGGPERELAQDFQKAEPYPVFLSEYTETMLHAPMFNDVTGIVKVYRTGIFDKTHRLLTNGQIRLPRRSRAMDEFATGCCKCVKKAKINRTTGLKTQHYRKIPPKKGEQGDDYRNALNYFVLAAGPMRIRQYSRYSGGAKIIQLDADNDYKRIG